ncbi:MAG: DUF86 domain-containing protein [Spirochaetia bacterium]|nr:DUF86 domain-containing protein [Spirochaetia bacterium]
MPIELDDICFNKAAIIERSLRRVKEEYQFDPQLKSFTHIDALILNVERACQATIDMAIHIIAVHHFGIPQNSGDSFSLLLRNNIITEITARQMISMTGFRNVAIHEYQSLDMAVVHHIAREGWQSMVSYCRELGVKIEP